MCEFEAIEFRLLSSGMERQQARLFYACVGCISTSNKFWAKVSRVCPDSHNPQSKKMSVSPKWSKINVPGTKQ